MFPPSTPMGERVRFEAETRELTRGAEHMPFRAPRTPFRFLRRIHLPTLNLGIIFPPRVQQRTVSECE